MVTVSDWRQKLSSVSPETCTKMSVSLVHTFGIIRTELAGTRRHDYAITGARAAPDSCLLFPGKRCKRRPVKDGQACLVLFLSILSVLKFPSVLCSCGKLILEDCFLQNQVSISWSTLFIIFWAKLSILFLLIVVKPKGFILLCHCVSLGKLS